MGPRPELPECIHCGACCFSELPTYVRMRGRDYDRVAERAEELTFFDHNRCHMRIEDGQCVALEVRRGGVFLCTAYDVRPDICRNLDRGSDACLAEFAQKRDRAKRAAARLEGE